MTGQPKNPQALKARLLADLVQAMSAGHLLQPTAVAVLVGRNAYDLVQQAVGTAPARDGSVDHRLQLHLRNVVSVVSVAERHFADVLLAVHWYRNERLGDGPQQTPEGLTAAGRLDDAYRLLLQPAKPLF